MEQLTFLQELHDLRSMRTRPRRAPRVPRETGRPCIPDPGQRVFDFERPPGGQRTARVLAFPIADLPRQRDAEGWYRLGCELDAGDPERARMAYARALALAPAHADAHLNLGCLDHEAGQLADAEAHYRAALAARAGDATAHFDLAVALEDQQRVDEAREAYLTCLADDPSYAEAHHNLARLCERAGDLAAALRHLLAYRRLIA